MTPSKKQPEPRTRGGWTPAGTGAKRREAHAQRSRPRGRERRAMVIAAAQEIFEEMGYEVARVEDIVERAGVSRGTFYTYFESKLDIFREVTDTALAEIDAAINMRPPDDVVGTAKRLAWTNELFIDTWSEHAKILGLLEHVAMVDDYIHERRLKARQANVARIAKQIRSFQEQGRANPDLDPATAARMLVSMLQNFAYWSFAGGDDYEPEAGRRAVSEMWLGAIGFTERPRRNAQARAVASVSAARSKRTARVAK